MTDDDVRAAVNAVLMARPEGADRDGVAALLTTLRRVRSRLDAIEVACTRRARELADAGAAEPAESLLGGSGGLGSRDADAAGERERVCGETADIEDALAAGDVTAAHVDAIAAAAKGLPEELRAEFLAHEARLLAAAQTESVDHFRRRCRRLARDVLAAQPRSAEDELARQRKQSRVRRWRDRDTGMHHTHLELDPERDANVWAAISAKLDKLRQRPDTDGRSYRELEIDAVVAATTSTGEDDTVPGVQVLIDYQTLISGLHDAGICETVDGVPLPVETVRRLCCDANIIPTVLGGDGRPLDVGRARRLATPEQRQALAAMHSTCSHPHCQMPFSACRIHHLDHWTRDRGPTDLDNLAPLCERHHHMVHDGGWTLTMTPDRTATWTRPDGTVWWTGPTTDRQPAAA